MCKQTKLCKKCNTEKSVNHFSRNSRTKDKLNWHCKDCHRGYTKKYRESHRKELREKSREYSKNNRAKKNEWARNNYCSEKEKIRRHKRKDQLKASFRKWYLANEYDSDKYIKKLICQKTTLNIADIPQSLVELKRSHLNLIRLARGKYEKAK